MSRNMRRALSGIPSLLHALRRNNIHFNLISPPHINPQRHPLHFLSRLPTAINPSISTIHYHGDRRSDSESDAEAAEGDGADFSPRDFAVIAEILRTPAAQEKTSKLEQCRLNLTQALVANVLSSVRNDWETAFAFFLWAEKQPGYAHARRVCHSMISILGKFRKFDTAWAVIEDMRAAALVSKMTILTLIRRYAAAHDVARAIGAPPLRNRARDRRVPRPPLGPRALQERQGRRGPPLLQQGGVPARHEKLQHHPERMVQRHRQPPRGETRLGRDGEARNPPRRLLVREHHVVLLENGEFQRGDEAPRQNEGIGHQTGSKGLQRPRPRPFKREIRGRGS